MSDQNSSFFKRLRSQINRGDSWLTYDLANLLPGGGITDEALEELEMRLLSADVGVDATRAIMGPIEKRVAGGQIGSADALIDAFHTGMTDVLQPCSQALSIPDFVRPFIILVVGVNGAGKTTTIGKMALRFKQSGLKVMLAAGDTFRAAAVEQLATWGERNDVPVVQQGAGADSASVIFDAVEAAKARNIDVLIADTAGRLHTQSHLMDELMKVKRVIQKHDPYAPHEVMLVLDSTTGQNGLTQALQFHEAVGLTGLTITKLDGTAKGGVLFAVAKRLSLPIRFIGVGESAEDLGVFSADEFVRAMLGRS